MEEVQIRLTGELAEHFDVYYRTCVKEKGWLGWAKNGESSGTDKYNYYIMALQCVIVPKDSGEPGNVGGIKSKYTSSYLVNGNPVLKFADFKTDYKTSKTMLGIDVSKYQGDINFKKVKAAGCEFVILRCYVRNNYYDKSKEEICLVQRSRQKVRAVLQGCPCGRPQGRRVFLHVRLHGSEHAQVHPGHDQQVPQGQEAGLPDRFRLGEFRLLQACPQEQEVVDIR